MLNNKTSEELAVTVAEMNKGIADMKVLIEGVSGKYEAEPAVFATMRLLVEAMFLKDRTEMFNTAFALLHAATEIYSDKAGKDPDRQEYYEQIWDAIGDCCWEYEEQLTTGLKESLLGEYAHLLKRPNRKEVN